MDTRYPTSLEFLGNELVMNVMVGSQVDFCWRLLSENGSLLVGKTVYVYWNGLPNPLQNSTNSSGIATYRWIPAENGTFWFIAVYYGNFYDIYRDSNEAKHVAYANLIPTSILFDVQPREFRPDTDITLTATVYNMVTNETLPNQTVKFYRFDDSNSSTLIDEDSTDGSGNASISWHYPASGVYAFSANVSGSDHLITSPVSLTVWQNETTLDVNPYVEDYTGEGAADLIALSVYLHCGDVPLAYRNVSVHLMEYNCTNDWETDYSGCASCLGLFFYGPVSQPFSAGFEVSFEGEGCRCASAYDFAPNMTQYTVCTTIQYSYKPSSNSTTITITPTAEDIERQTRKPEEMEQEAKNNGWFSVEHEFIRFFPWYRIHYRITVNETIIDVGFCPFSEIFGLFGRIVFNLQGAETYMWDGLEIFSKVAEECWQQIITESLVLFGEFITAKAGHDDWKVAIIALGLEGVSEVWLLNMYWDNWKEMLAMGLANIILGLISLRIDIAEAFVNALTGIVTTETMAALTLIRQGTVAIGQIQTGTRTWVDMTGIGIFLVSGAIALGRGLEVMMYG